MAEESERDESKERRRRWMMSLSVFSSDDEDSVAGNMIYSPLSCSFEKDEMIALRFPYPMFSDESEEEFPNSFNSVKRKLSFTSDRSIKTSTENQSYKHKKRKRKQTTNEKSIKEKPNCDKNVSSRNGEEISNTVHTILKERREASNNKYKPSSLSNRSLKRSKNVKKLENYSSSDDNVFQDKSVVIRINPRRGKQICKYIDSPEISDDEYARVKASNNHSNLPTSVKPTSRFLDSSSDGDNSKCTQKKKMKTTSRPKQNFRRLHVLSTSSSGSDVEDSTHKVNECKLNINTSSVKPCHSMSASNDEKENDSEANCISVNNKIDCAKVSFSDPSNNAIEPCQINKIINSAELEYRARKHYLPNKRFQVNTGCSNVNSSAWKNIANIQLKAEAKSSSHQSLVQTLKKKLLSSNMSSIEVHKKMHSRPIIITKDVKKNSDSKKRLKLSISHGKEDDVLEDNRDNVTVTVPSEVNSTKANTSAQDTELIITSHTDSQKDQPKEKLNVNIESSQAPLVNVESESESATESNQANSKTIAPQLENEDIDVNVPGFNKKVRHSHFNKLNVNKRNSLPLQKDISSVRKKQNVHLIKTKSNNSSNSDETCTTKDPTETSTVECDVLGTILSQMENNPYKVQKVPVTNKKTLDPVGQLLGWNDSPVLTGQLQMTAFNINKIQHSTLPFYSPLNNKNEIQQNNYVNNHIVKSLDSTTTCKERFMKTNTEAVIPFYLPSNEEYGNSATHQNISVNNARVATNHFSLPQNSYSETAKNNIKISKTKHMKDNSTNIKSKKPLVRISSKPSEKGESNYEENVNTKSSRKNSIESKEDNQKSTKRKMSTGEKLDVDVTNRVKKSINIGPSNCTGNEEILKEIVAKKINNVGIKSGGKGESNYEENVNPKSSRKNSIESKEDKQKSTKRKMSTGEKYDVGVTKCVEKPINCRGNEEILKEIVAKKINNVGIKLSGKGESNYEENINPKLSRNSCILPNEHNKKSAKRKISSGKKLDEDCVKELIKEGPVSCTGNRETSKDIIAKKINNEENEIPQKGTGIRVKFGGNVFRLTCGSNKVNENISIHTVSVPGFVPSKSSDPKRRDSVSYDANDPKKCQSVKPTHSSTNQTTNHPISDQSEDSSSSSDETSSSSSSKSDSTDECSAMNINSTTKMPKLGDETNSNFDCRITSILEEDNLGKKGNSAPLIPNNTKKTITINEENAKKNAKEDNSSSDSVIILSESSDSENSNFTINKGPGAELKSDTCNPTAQVEKSDNSNDTSQNNLSISKIGKIRIKSLKELGNNNPLPKNALPSTVSAAESSSVQVDLNVPKTLSLQDSMLNKLLDRVHNPEVTSLPPETPSSRAVLCSNLDKLFQVLPKSSTESSENQQKAIAVIKPVCSNITPASNSGNSLVNSVEKTTTITENVIQQTSSQANVSKPTNPSGTTVEIPNTERVGDLQQENNLAIKYVQVPLAKKETETLFFTLCDNLFTELVYFKIPKLVDDLHLCIVYDIMKEERLKKIEQLISHETIITEKRRAEKDYADMIKVRGQSFVPLFLTIVDKIKKVDFRSLVIAVYCRIVQQLERVDAVNHNYRYKLRHLIKSLIEKFSNGGHEDLCAIFGLNDANFITSFVFIEDLLLKYDKFVEKRQLASNQSTSANKNIDNNTSTKNNTTSQPPTVITNTVSAKRNASTRSSVEEIEATQTEVGRLLQNPPKSTSKPPSIPIGNLDQMLLFKLTFPAKPSTSEH